jgi:hypothetical protein
LNKKKKEQLEILLIVIYVKLKIKQNQNFIVIGNQKGEIKMGFEPVYKPKNKIICPLKFANPLKKDDNDFYCEGIDCAWWMINQKACAINVVARLSGYLKLKFDNSDKK